MLHALSRNIRAMRHQPWLTLVTVATLAVGIGANTAMFSMLRAVVLRPLPVAGQDRLVMIWSRSVQRDQQVAEVSFGEYQEWRARSRSFEDLSIHGSVLWTYRITAPGRAADVSYSSVSAGFFDSLGVRPVLGRGFRRDDDSPGAPRTAVLSAGLWQRRFGGDPQVVGRTLTIGDGADAVAFEVVGVMPAAFDFPRGAELWTAAAPDLAAFGRASKGGFPLILRVFYGTGRLKTGVSADTAAADLNRISRDLVAASKRAPAGEVAVLTPLSTYVFGNARPALLALMGAVGLVLLIACANVSSLLLARGVARRREVAVRLALGANPGHLVRQLLGEAAVVAGLGGVLGVALAALSLDALIALSPADIPRLDQTRLDRVALLFALGVSLATALLVGLVPAWQMSHPSLVAHLSQGTRGGGAVSGRTRQALVVGEIALTLVLLIGAGLMVRSFARLARLDLGFNPKSVLTFHVSGPSDAYDTLDQQRALTTALIARYERTPGVVAAGAVYQRPFEHGPIGMDTSFILPEQYEARQEDNDNPILNWESVTPGYFRAMGIELRRGRLFDDRDSEKAPPAVIVSDALADRVWPGQDPLGKQLRAYGAEGRWQTVVGVVETARYREIDAPRLDIYLPYLQAPTPVQHFVVRTTDEPTTLTASLRHETTAFDPDITMDGVTTMGRIVERTQGPWRFNMLVFGAFGVVALVLAAMGLFSLVAHAVSLRTREIGIRMAIGASQRDVVALMVRQATRLAVIGLVAGLLVAYAVSRVVGGLLFGVTATDPLTFTGVALGLLGVAMLASYLPARRAARIDPLVALQIE